MRPGKGGGISASLKIFYFFSKKDLRDTPGIVYTINSAHQAHVRRKSSPRPLAINRFHTAWFLVRPKTADLPL